MVRLVSLGHLFGVPSARQAPEEGLVVIVEGIGRRVGLVVDDVVSQQQVVIKNIENELGRSRYLLGAAIMPDGKVGLILNIDEIAASVTTEELAATAQSQSPAANASAPAP